MPKKASIQRDTNRKRKKEEERERLKEIKRKTKVAAKSKAARDRKKLAAKPVPCHMAMGDDAPEHAHWVPDGNGVCIFRSRWDGFDTYLFSQGSKMTKNRPTKTSRLARQPRRTLHWPAGTGQGRLGVLGALL